MIYTATAAAAAAAAATAAACERRSGAAKRRARPSWRAAASTMSFGWLYSSSATRLIRPRLFCGNVIRVSLCQGSPQFPT